MPDIDPARDREHIGYREHAGHRDHAGNREDTDIADIEYSRHAGY